MIAGLPKRPRVADLSGVTLTLDQAAFLGKQRTLVGLQLRGCPIGDEQVLELCSLDRMANLDLSDTLLTDRALEALALLPKLTRLALDGTSVTGEGLASFATHPTLSTLSMSRTKLCDAQLGLAAAIPKLTTLLIDETLVTAGGLRALATNELLRVYGGAQFSQDEMDLFETHQRDVAAGRQGRTRPDASLVDIGRETIVAFFRAIDDWERGVAAAYPALTPEALLAAHPEGSAIFARFCTDKAVKGDPAMHHAYRRPPSHEKERIVAFEQESKTKLWAYTKRETYGDYRYLLVKTASGWKIDRCQLKSEGWLSHPL